MDKPLKIKLSENVRAKGLESKFSISYSSKNMDNKQISYKIISALKGKDSIIIEIDSSLLTIDENEKTLLKFRLTDSFENLGLNFINKKVSYDMKRSILSVTIESKKIEGFKIYIDVTDDTWQNQDFVKLIPETGVRYYISGQFKALDTFVNTDEEEQTEICSMVIFDHISLGSMGINTSKNKEEIRGLLTGLLPK